jgi:hypothetical protein
VLEILVGDTFEDIGSDSREGKLRVWKLNETGFVSFPITDFGVGCLGFSSFATRRLAVN